MRCVIVSHTHWDREWYRTFQSFRARLIDTVDRVLDLVAADPGYHFLLDGQTIAVEDYLELRPERRDELEAACRAGRVAIGPWYVQPDSLLPSGEAHVRNLLEGRRVAETLGPCSRIAYTPDSFGHPAQFPQLFAGFGLEPFVYWRGNANEIDTLGSDYAWRAPDGSRIRCCHLSKGYFSAWGFGADIPAVVKRIQTLADDLSEAGSGEALLFMNGLDHMHPDENTLEVAEAIAKETGWEVRRGLLDDYVRLLPERELPEFGGELVGARVAPLLPGVWSTRTHLKLDNRRCESALEGWAEPWSALAALHGAADETASLRAAWRPLLANQAHDSICGCSKDRVHEQMQSRYESAAELAHETSQRALERVAGLGVTRQVPADGSLEIAVFNPSPHPRSEPVRFPLDGFPAFTSTGIARFLGQNIGAEGFTIDGRPARAIALEESVRPRPIPGQPVYDLEFVAEDVPAFGWKRLRVERSEARPDEVDDGDTIATRDVEVQVEPAGSLRVRLGTREYAGLLALEDVGDRGDSYDFDPVPGEESGPGAWPEALVSTTRRRHASGIQELELRRRLEIPEALSQDRQSRAKPRVDLELRVVARVADGVPRVDLEIELDNRARDHRLRLLFPSGRPCEAFHAATTFDTTRRTTSTPDDSGWVQPAPRTFPHQGWVSLDGLTVLAPGLQEAEVTPEGTLAITLLRSVGWLSRPDLASRPGEAGPSLTTPGAQCLGPLRARLCLLAAPIDAVPGLARDAELGLRAVAAGPEPLVPPERPLLTLMPAGLVVSALKPAQSGEGIVLRVLNPSDDAVAAKIGLGFDVAAVELLDLDESPRADPHSAPALKERVVELNVPPHALRTLRLRPARREPAMTASRSQ